MPATPAELANQEWVDQRFVLGRLGNAWLDVVPDISELDKELESWRNMRHRYSELGGWLNSSFKRFIRPNLHLLELSGVHGNNAAVIARRKQVAIEFTNDSGVEWGFTVKGHILGAAAIATRYAINNGLRIDQEVLKKTLDNGTTYERVHDKLASMAPAVNEQWERDLLLDTEGDIEEGLYLEAEPPFLIVAGDEGPPLFDINPVYGADIESKLQFMEDRYKTGKACPAREIFLRRLWGTMVGMAFDSRYLFRQDIPGFGVNLL